jgi:hypothetical protein
MAKRNKHPARRTQRAERQERSPAHDTPNERAALVANPPARHLSFLAFSILLFAAWFVFLFITALFG